MKDIILWELLIKGVHHCESDADTEQLCGLLHQLAVLPVEERFPLIGLLPDCLSHPRPEVRAAAATALSDASGFKTFEWLVTALDDSDPEILRAAVTAMRASAKIDPDRWVHLVEK